MKVLVWLFLISSLTLLEAREVNAEQVKVAYTYNFLKHTSWPNETRLNEYHILVVSKNESLKNLFMMLSSRKLLNEKKIRVSFYDFKILPKGIQALYVDEASAPLYEKLFDGYESDNVLFISDGYKDRKKVMINLVESNGIVTFEINKPNLLNRSLKISPDLVLLGGSEIDVARLYKSSQDELREQKEAVTILNRKIAEKNGELTAKITAIEKQKSALAEQQAKIDLQNATIAEQFRNITAQSQTIRAQQSELESIRRSIDAQKRQLATDEKKIRESEMILAHLLKSHHEKQQEINRARSELETLNGRIEHQKANLVQQEGVITTQREMIGTLLFLGLIIVVLAVFVFKQNRRLNELSHTDPLTGLLNRRAFVPKIEHEMDKFDRYGTPLSILLIDVDYFKTINDTLGHDQGDSVLKTLSQLMRDLTRRTDLCVRWGGEEFMILAAATPAEEALKMGDKLRDAIGRHDFAIGRAVTVSIGIATSQKGENGETLIRNADEALYRAKKSGRNRVVSA